jgi:hypothetical protein
LETARRERDAGNAHAREASMEEREQRARVRELEMALRQARVDFHNVGHHYHVGSSIQHAVAAIARIDAILPTPPQEACGVVRTIQALTTELETARVQELLEWKRHAQADIDAVAGKLVAAAGRVRDMKTAITIALDELEGDIDQEAIERATGVKIPAINRVIAILKGIGD